MKSSNKLGKRNGYHLSIQGIWKGNIFREKWYIKEQGVRTRGGASPYKTCWVPPPPPLGLCQLFGNHAEFTIVKGEPILTGGEFLWVNFFFLFKQHCGKAWGRCYLEIPDILGLSPDSSLTGFFRFSIWRRENGAEWQGSSREGGRCCISRTERYLYYHRASNDRSVLSQSLTILCSVAGISHSRGRYFLIRG